MMNNGHLATIFSGKNAKTINQEVKQALSKLIENELKKLLILHKSRLFA